MVLLGWAIAIEPIPITAHILQRVVDRLQLSNVEIKQVAVGDRNCRVAMVYSETEYNFKSLCTAQALTHGEVPNSAVYVNMLSLTSLVDLLGVDRVNFVKCDIEGAEMQFFQGGRSILARDKPTIICEIEHRHTSRFGYAPEDIFNFLELLGYQSFTYDSNSLVLTKIPSAAEINYVFIHRSDRPRIELLSGTGVANS